MAVQPLTREEIDSYEQHASYHETEDEKRATGLPPEVVERHDVGMLETSDELCLGLEAPDERAIIGEIGTDHLDGNVAIERRMMRSVHAAERTFADELLQDVAAQRMAEVDRARCRVFPVEQ